MKVLVINPRLAERIKKVLPEDIEVLKPQKGTDEELIKLVSDVEVIISTRLSSEVAIAATKLKLLQKTGAGVDDMPFTFLRDEVYVANTSGSNPTPMAEGAVAMVLALAKRIVQRHLNFNKKRESHRGVLLQGKKAGIIGLGSIGIEVAKLLQAFEMKILAIKRHPDEELKDKLDLEWLGSPDKLLYLLKESDFIIVTVPLTPETKGMIGEEELKHMKATSFIINVARAAIIQEEPLFRALKEKRIAGAGLDVWWNPHWWDPIWQPIGTQASQYPFWDLPNVIATPHNIVSCDVSSDAGFLLIVKNILRVRDGKPPLNQVDKKLRY